MVEVFQVWVQLEPPSRRYPAGKTVLGHYTITDGILTLTDPKGTVAEDADGRTYSEKIEPSGNHQAVGGRLTKRLRAVLRGESPDAPERVSKPLNYPKNTGYF
jgi:hypothetical protein